PGGRGAGRAGPADPTAAPRRSGASHLSRLQLRLSLWLPLRLRFLRLPIRRLWLLRLRRWLPLRIRFWLWHPVRGFRRSGLRARYAERDERISELDGLQSALKSRRVSWTRCSTGGCPC